MAQTPGPTTRPVPAATTLPGTTLPEEQQMTGHLDLTPLLRRIPAAAALPEEDFTALVRTVYNELETRVGTAISKGLSNAQLLEFQTLINYETAHPGLGPDRPTVTWLRTHAPHYARTVQDTLDQLLTDTTTALTPEH